jgi:hypothetical protein
MLGPAWWLRTAAVIVLAATACGSVQHGQSPLATASPTSSPTASAASPTTASGSRQRCPAVQPAPQFLASAPSNRNLVLVTLRGGSDVVVRDITDINHATTIGGLSNPSHLHFVSGTEWSYLGGNQDVIYRAPFSGSPSTVVATGCNNVFDFAWSPDGTAAAYVTDTDAGGELHLVNGGQNRVVSTMPGLPITGCVACADSVDLRLLYSPDGAFISLVQSWGGPLLRLWTSDGRVIESIDSGSVQGGQPPSMSAWSASRLYYRDSSGVRVWDHGTVTTLLPGVQWIRPRASPAGGEIVYGARDANGTVHVYLLDTAIHEVRELAKSRSEPAFLTSRYIWYQGERHCLSSDPYPCNVSPSYSTTTTGITYIYDLQTGTEAESIITAVFDVWPHPA